MNMSTKVNASKSNKIINGILEILFSEKEVGFERILENLSKKKICKSRTTLAKYLNQLHQERLISYHTDPKNKRKTLYRIVNFEDNPLYPAVFGALITKIVQEAWLKQFSPVSDKLDKILQSPEKIEDVTKTRAELNREMMEITEKSIIRFENVIGNIILRSLVYQKETDIQIVESLTHFIRFIYLGLLKNNRLIKSVYQKDNSLEQIKNAFSIPYTDIEEMLMGYMAADIKYNKLMMEAYGAESPVVKVDADFYELLGFPFNVAYNKKIKKIS